MNNIYVWRERTVSTWNKYKKDNIMDNKVQQMF